MFYYCTQYCNSVRVTCSIKRLLRAIRRLCLFVLLNLGETVLSANHACPCPQPVSIVFQCLPLCLAPSACKVTHFTQLSSSFIKTFPCRHCITFTMSSIPRHTKLKRTIRSNPRPQTSTEEYNSVGPVYCGVIISLTTPVSPSRSMISPKSNQLYHTLSENSSKFTHNFLSYLADRQTDRQTCKHKGKSRTSLAEVIM